ncbi:MAG: hypothetical protein HY304_03480 [candidate division Zixibacteria bacterium]|nr:hypothetical protein [candidate division Zixibacteria bacterium]
MRMSAGWKGRCGSVILAALLMVSASGRMAEAQPVRRMQRRPAPPPTPGLWGKTLTGGHLGPWFARDFGHDVTQPGVRLDASSTAFHLEFFYQPHLMSILNLDFNVGAVSRGDLRQRDATSSVLGTATLVPIGAGVIAFPLARFTGLRLQPSLRAGGSLVIGTERFERLYQNTYGVGTSTQSRSTWGYYAGGGLNWLLGPSVALIGSVKYQRARFDNELFGLREYSGTQVLFGAAYLYR